MRSLSTATASCDGCVEYWMAGWSRDSLNTSKPCVSTTLPPSTAVSNQIATAVEMGMSLPLSSHKTGHDDTTTKVTKNRLDRAGAATNGEMRQIKQAFRITLACFSDVSHHSPAGPASRAQSSQTRTQTRFV